MTRARVGVFARESRPVLTGAVVVGLLAAVVVGAFVDGYAMWLRVVVSVVTLVVVAGVLLGVARVVRGR